MAFPSRTRDSIKQFARLPFFVINDPADANPVFFVNDTDQPAQALGLNLAALFTSTGVIAGAAHATGVLRFSLVVGEDETSTHQITVSGMAVGDEVVSVLVYATAASIATAAAHAGTFTAAAGKITPGTEVNNTNNQYLVIWNDRT